MNKYPLFIFIINGIIIMSCILGCHDSTKDHAIPSKSLDFSMAEYFDLEELKNVEILPIFSDTNVYVDQMRYGQVTEEYYIFISSQYRIHVFDHEFQFVNSILDMGKCPGEVIMPYGLSKSDKDSEFYIVDSGNRKIQRMDVSGEVVEDIVTDHWRKNANKVSDEEKQIVGNVNDSKTPETGKSYDLLLLDSKGEIVQGYFEFEDDGAFGMGNGRNLHRISADHFGYYRMYEDRIFHVYADGPQQAYLFNLEKPLLPSNLVVDHVRGNIGLDEFVYFLSYFEDESHLLLTYELDRNKYWSVYDKINDNSHNYKFSYADDCGDCNNINTIALTKEGAIAVVSGETLLRILGRNKIAASIPSESNVEDDYYLIQISFSK